MHRSHMTVAILAAGAIFSLASPARAQIATTVDPHGKQVFVNDDSPAGRRGSTISSPAVPRGFRSTLSPATSATDVTDPRLDRIVRDAADRHHVDQALVKAVINQESGWNAGAVSRKGAIGLMQLIPGTAQRFGAGNPFDPAQNVEAGTTYLKSLLDRYNNNLSLSLAAYNAGEHAVDLNGGVPAYRETQQYVQKVTEAYFRSDSGRNTTLWAPPRRPVRKEVDSKGRVVYTNE
jgi:soluble lytic murein transglycosylase-like protein